MGNSILSNAYSKIDVVFGVSKTTTESFINKFPNYKGKTLTLNTYFDKEKYMDLAKEIGKFYNVSDNTVRKWCKSYGLPCKYNEIKEELSNPETLQDIKKLTKSKESTYTPFEFSII